jgi:hypothetical protein
MNNSNVFLLGILLSIIFSVNTSAQSIVGGAGITLVDSDPDSIIALQTVSAFESNVAFDQSTQKLYFYDGSQSLGQRWTEVSISSLSSPDTRLDAPRVENGSIVFDVINVVTGAITSTESISISSIAPVQSIAGGGDISVSNDGNGNFTISFTEAVTALALSGNVLTYTDENGDDNTINLPTSDGSDTKIEAGNNKVQVTGSGTAISPYQISFNETVTSLSYDAPTATITYTNENNATNSIKLFRGSITNEGNGTYTHSDGGNPPVTSTIDTRASSNPISDSGGHFTSSNVEGALQEVGEELDSLNSDITNLETNITNLQNNSHVPAQAVDGTSIDFSVSGTDNQTITAEIKGFNSASSGQIPVIDSNGQLTWQSSVSLNTVQGATNGATLNGNNVELEISNLGETTTIGDNAEFAVSQSGTDAKIKFSNLSAAMKTEMNASNPMIKSLAFNSDGELIATLADNSQVAIDLSQIPRVGNSDALEQVAQSLGAGQEGMAMAAKHNRMGVPANDDWGVLFFVQGK